MDGRKPALRHLFVAALACTGSVGVIAADDFIRPPARSQPTSTTTQPSESNSKSVAPAPILQPGSQINSASQSLSPAGPDRPTLIMPRPVAQPAPASPQATQPTPSTKSTLVSQPTRALESSSGSAQRALPQNKSRVPSGPTNLAPPLVPSSREQALRENLATANNTVSSNQTSVPASTLNWQPRGGRGPNMHLSGYTQNAPVPLGGQPLSLSESRPTSVFVDPQSSASVNEELPQVPPEAVPQSDGQRDVRLVMQPSALDSEQAEQLRSRRELAARISEELSTQRPVAQNVVASSIEPGPGWQAVGEELKRHLSNCEQLLSRKAYLSAMEESNVAILKLVRVLDLRQNQLISEPAWGKAQQALREAQEFTSVQRVAGDVDLFTRLIQSHETPTLHGVSTRDLTPLAAAQHYRAYAERCLVEASQGHPWFSELYYCKGRALQSQAENGHTQADNMLQTALTYYRAARTIQPTNATNSNQLGYVLLRMDRATEAISQLAETVQLPNCPLETWQNIAQASSRLGDERTQQWALQNYANLKLQGVQPSGPINTLVELDPKQFAALSPPSVGPNGSGSMSAAPAMNYQPGGAMMAPAPAPVQSMPAAPNRTANTPRFGIFR